MTDETAATAEPADHDVDAAETETEPETTETTETDTTDADTSDADADTTDATVTPRLRPGSSPVPTSPPGRAGHVRTLPAWVLLLLGLAVLVVLAAFRPGEPAAVVGVPLALVLPGAVLQPRFLPGLRTDPVTMWCLRGAVSLAAWVLTALAVGVAGIPVRSVWTVVVGAVLLAAVVVGDHDRARSGGVGVRQAGWGLAVLLVAALVALGGRGLVEIAGGGASDRAPAPVVLEFADPVVPVALTPTGARATVDVAVTNAGDDDVRVDLTAVVGRSLPWSTVGADVPAGATRVVTLAGAVAVCEDPQQAVVSIAGAGPVTALSAVLPGTAGAISCGGR